MAPDSKDKTPVTSLNKYDRKILDKYTKFYSNFIESNTAKTEILDDSNYERKEY
ncbi:MAG: hypothetical protein N3I35_05700 [Clostridia bacterium]|nr:hypothetical protein [Clostridia bacterium]